MTLNNVLSSKQKHNLRVVSQKDASKLIKNKIITDILIKNLKPLMKKCKLLIFEDDRRDIILQLKYEEKGYQCIGGKKRLAEQPLLNIHIDQAKLLEMRRQIRFYQMLKRIYSNARRRKNYKMIEKLASITFKKAERKNKIKDWESRPYSQKKQELEKVINNFLAYQNK